MKEVGINKILIITLIALSAVSCTLSILQFAQQDKIRFVSIGSLVEEFAMTKEKKNQMQSLQLRRKGFMDSIAFNLKQLERRIESGEAALTNEYESKRELYLEKSKTFAEEDETIEEQIQKQIYSQINQYVENYGKEKGIDVIFGATGDGGVMYLDKDLDITKEMVKYINQQYSGKS